MEFPKYFKSSSHIQTETYATQTSALLKTVLMMSKFRFLEATPISTISSFSESSDIFEKELPASEMFRRTYRLQSEPAYPF